MTERAKSILDYCIRSLKPGEIYRIGISKPKKDIAALKLLLVEHGLTRQFEVVKTISSVGLVRLPRRRLDENYFPIE